MMLWANYELIRSTDIELASWFSRLRQLFSYLATALIAITLWYYARFFKIISNKGIRYFMLFGMLIPAFGFAALECTPYFFGTVVQISNNNWGIKIDQASLLDWLRFIWTAIAFIASLVFTLFSYFSAKDKQQRPIRLFLVFVMAIGLSITLYQSYIVPLFFSFNIVRNDSFIVFWGVLIYALAFSDLKLFRLEPNRAVDSILQSMTNLMIITNNYFQIKDVNQAAIQFFQKDLNDIQDQLIAQLIQEETWTHVRERIRIQGDYFKKEELEISMDINGVKRHLLLIITPYLQRKKRIGYIFIGTDLTAIENAIEKEKQVAHLQTRFVAIASHQFRTPLTSIKLNVNLLKRAVSKDRPDKERMFRFLERIDNEIERITDLMNDLLTLGKLEAGKMQINLQEYDLEKIVSDLLDHDFNTQNDKRQLKVVVHPPASVVVTDKKIIEHVLINLISNAFKYSPGAPPPELHLFFKENGFKINVIDYGIGIPEKDQENLFKSFYRGSNTVQIQGSGLGLVIVKELLELINGTITFESQENQGTIFKLTVNQTHE